MREHRVPRSPVDRHRPLRGRCELGVLASVRVAVTKSGEAHGRGFECAGSPFDTRATFGSKRVVDRTRRSRVEERLGSSSWAVTLRTSPTSATTRLRRPPQPIRYSPPLSRRRASDRRAHIVERIEADWTVPGQGAPASTELTSAVITCAPTSLPSRRLDRSPHGPSVCARQRRARPDADPSDWGWLVEDVSEARSLSGAQRLTIMTPLPSPPSQIGLLTAGLRASVWLGGRRRNRRCWGAGPVSSLTKPERLTGARFDVLD